MIPIIVDGDPLVLDPSINDGKLMVYRPTGTERQRLVVHKIDVSSDPDDNGQPFYSSELQAAVGERSIAVVASHSGVVLLIIDKKTWKVRRATRIPADATGDYTLVHAYVAAAAAACSASR